tara:strand:- start:322 stop:1482 length:1161 start_codon:yes stop_codon:yes gene_type:complete
MSEIKVNSIKGVAASTAALTINNTDGTCTANITNRSNKNLILNGAFQIAQRGVSSTSSGYQTVDRFYGDFSGTDEAPTFAQVDLSSSDTPYSLGFRKAFKITNGNQTSGAGTADKVLVYQRIEAQNLAQSGWNYTSSSSNVTLSFWVKSSVAQNFYGYLRAPDGTSQNYPFETGSLSADTWTKITKTISGNSNLTIDNNNNIGLEVNIVPFWGTDNTGSVSLNAWAAFNSSVRMPDNTSTWYTTNDATFEITGVQLEVSDHATSFQFRSFAEELALCQRYFFRTPAFGTGTTSIYLGSGVEAGSSARIAFIMPQVMRTAPTVTAGDLNSDDEQSTTDASTVSAVVAGSSNCDRMRIQLTGGSYNAGNAVSLVCANANGFLAGDAEL